MARELELLDFPRVQSALAERTQTALGAEAAWALSPTSKEEAEARHRRIEEARFFPLRLGGVRDLRPMLAQAERGEVLSGEDLLAAASTLARAMELKSELATTEHEALKEVAAKIGDHRGFTKSVFRALDETGEVRDEASEKLKKIRARIAPLKRRIQEKVYDLLNRHAEDLADRFVTLRRGRYVLPVKAERVHRVPGVVLDRSSSGATYFVEPLAIVPLNNELARLLLEEEAEVRRILAELTAKLAQDPHVEDTLAALAELDLTEAARRLAEDWNLTRPTFGPPGRYALKEAFHPLIKNPVKNDLALDERRRFLLVSGPNMGGKTALLKTLGLAQAMAQSGLFVPAAAAEIPFVRAILTDIGDEQDILADLSTFASHLKRLKEILEKAGPDTLVLVDELGTGTDPEEGAALGQAILEELLKKGARGIVTTHLAPLKAFAASAEGVENASMAFDLERFAPTYRLVVGVPGRSYAFAIAERLGFPKGPLERAQALLGEGARTAEALLARLEEEKRTLEDELKKTAAERQRAERARRELEARLAAIESERQRVLKEARAEADRLLLEAERQIKRAKERAKTEAGKKDALRQVMELRQRYRPEKRRNPYPDLKPGTQVEVPDYRAKGRVLELRGDVALVQIGLLKVEVPIERLKPRDEGAPRPTEAVVVKSGFEPELNLRGLTQAEALLALDEFLTEAYALKETPVRILHGKGTGALRTAVRQALKRDKRVKHFHDAMPYEGGHGAQGLALAVKARLRVVLGKKHLQDRRGGHGEQRPPKPKERGPGEDGEDHRHRVKLGGLGEHPRGVEVGLELVLDDEDQDGPEHHPKPLGGRQQYREQKRDDAAEVGDEVEDGADKPQRGRHRHPHQGVPHPQGEPGEEGHHQLAADVAAHRPVELGGELLEKGLVGEGDEAKEALAHAGEVEHQVGGEQEDQDELEKPADDLGHPHHEPLAPGKQGLKPGEEGLGELAEKRTQIPRGLLEEGIEPGAGAEAALHPGKQRAHPGQKPLDEPGEVGDEDRELGHHLVDEHRGQGEEQKPGGKDYEHPGPAGDAAALEPGDHRVSQVGKGVGGGEDGQHLARPGGEEVKPVKKPEVDGDADVGVFPDL